MSQAPF